MGYVLSKIIGTLLTPGALLLVGLGVGVALLWSRGWRRGRLLLTLLVVVFAALALSPVDSMMLAPLENRFPANPTLPERVDGIIILGGAVDQYQSQVRHQISMNDSGERMLVGAVLGRLHPEARIIVSGGAADPRRPEPKEAAAMAELLISLGIPPSRILAEDQSRNTFENAVFSQRLAQPRKGEVWILITSAWHMPRSVGCFRSVGWTVIPFPVDFNTGGGSDWINNDGPVLRLSRLSKAVHEWFGLAFYRLSGWTDTLFPGPDTPKA